MGRGCFGFSLFARPSESTCSVEGTISTHTLPAAAQASFPLLDIQALSLLFYPPFPY
jgi:hypothetical protein